MSVLSCIRYSTTQHRYTFQCFYCITAMITYGNTFYLILSYLDAFHSKCFYVSLCLSRQSAALASTEEDGYCECSVELKLDFEADTSALPLDVLKS